MVSQTSVIFFGLLVGFVVYITVRGELADYLYVLGLAGGSGSGRVGANGVKVTTPTIGVGPVKITAPTVYI